MAVFVPDHPWYPPSWLFNRDPLQFLPKLDPPGASAPPTAFQKVLSGLGLGGAAPEKGAPAAAAAKRSVVKKRS